MFTCTQPLLPYLQQVYNSSVIGISLTVSATILAIALMAPVVGLMAESIGRKKVIVPSLYALTVPTLLAATSQSLHALIFWRFMQGLFVPGVIVVMMAYINEEFAWPVRGPRHVRLHHWYCARWFSRRYISGLVAHHFDWRGSFVAVGLINLAGAIAVQRALPTASNFVRPPGGAPRYRKALSICATLGFWPYSAWDWRRCFASWGSSPM